jgi:PadR family transcriptional regulator, regulatory protein PadR
VTVLRTRPPHLTIKWNTGIFTGMSGGSVELLQGTLDLIVLQALSTMGPLHAYSLAARLEQVSSHRFSLNQGTLYPALVRLEQKGWIKGAWQKTENNRDAKYYGVTKAGRRALARETARWRRLAGLVETLLLRET